MCMTQYGGIVSHLGVGVLEVVDEDGGEAAHHPDADVEQEKWKEAQKLSAKSSLPAHNNTAPQIHSTLDSTHAGDILYHFLIICSVEYR